MKRIALVFALAGCLCAQVNTASLTGIVKDATDAAVAKARVTVVQKETNIRRTAETDGVGNYFFPVLPVGAYEVIVEAQGFNRATASVTLETAQKGRQDFTLAVGTVETSVTVAAQAPQLSTQDASLGSVVDNSYVNRFPLLLRSWDDLMSLVAGVQGNRYTDQGGGTSFGRQGGFNVHGVRSLQNNFTLDGIDNNTISENVQELSSQVVRPSLDTLQEFKVTTNPYTAEFGRSPGGAISVTTKGGTNRLHGLLYEYLRNRVLDANDFFSNRNRLAKPQNIQNQFGGNVGGPVVKDKLFYFFDYEGTRIRRAVSRISSTMLPNEKLGVFTRAASGAANVNYATIYDPTNAQPFTGNTIPAARIDPVARKLFDLFPAPTNPAAQLNNYARNAALLDDTDRFNVRSDWQPTGKDSIFGRYSWSVRDRFIPGNFGGIADGTSSSALGRQHMTAHGVALGWTRVISASLVNESRAGFLRNNSFAEQEPFGKNRTSDYVPGVPVNPQIDGGVPRTLFSGINTFIGSPDFLPKFQVTQQYQWVNNLAWTRGPHALKFGADLRFPLRNNYMDVPATRGQLNFDRIFTCQRNVSNQCVSGTGLPYADGLLGYVQQAALTNVYLVDQRLHMYSFFVQDDYKLSPKLTLNLGLRYDFSTPALEGRNRIVNFNPAGAGSLVFGKDGSLADRALVSIDRNNWAPRIGIAYQLAPKTVWRMGYGLFYTLFDRMGSEDQISLNPPYLINNNISIPSTSTQPLFLLRNGFPANFLDPAQLSLTRVRVRAANPEAPQTSVHQWSTGFQRELPLHLFVQADYVGTKTTHLNLLKNFNQPLGGSGPLPYPNFQQIEYRDPGGNAVYHGLDLTVERRFTSGLMFRAAYTVSKSIDNTGEHLATTQSFNQDGRNFKAWRGPSDFDCPQRFVLSYVYDLPFGKGRRWLTNGAAAYVLGGWRTSGALTFAAGRPFTPVASTNNSSIDRGLHVALPNAVGPAQVPRNIDCYFYSSRTAACRALFPSATDFLTIPPAGVFGNVGRNVIRAPGTKLMDFALHKEFPFLETRALEFRWEMFNLTNTTQFGYPDRNASGGSGGVITTLAADPRLMQFALRLKF